MLPKGLGRRRFSMYTFQAGLSSSTLSAINSVRSGANSSRRPDLSLAEAASIAAGLRRRHLRARTVRGKLACHFLCIRIQNYLGFLHWCWLRAGCCSRHGRDLLPYGKRPQRNRSRLRLRPRPRRPDSRRRIQLYRRIHLAPGLPLLQENRPGKYLKTHALATRAAIEPLQSSFWA